MGRPLKTGLDYFPLDVSMDDDFELLEAEHGLEGFAILVKLWQKIYSSGYYIEWKDDNALLFSRRINADINKVNSVVNTCLNRNIFNKSKYTQYKILTSSGIQKRYFKACADSKRKKIPAIKDYLIKTQEIIELITEFIELNQEESTQKKGKESIYIAKEVFEEFWSLYHEHINLPKTDKEPALKHWLKLTKQEHQLAIDKIISYSKTKPISEHKYLKKARTFLSDKAFNDDMLELTKQDRSPEGW